MILERNTIKGTNMATMSTTSLILGLFIASTKLVINITAGKKVIIIGCASCEEITILKKIPMIKESATKRIVTILPNPDFPSFKKEYTIASEVIKRYTISFELLPQFKKLVTSNANLNW